MFRGSSTSGADACVELAPAMAHERMCDMKYTVDIFQSYYCLRIDIQSFHALKQLKRHNPSAIRVTSHSVVAVIRRTRNVTNAAKVLDAEGFSCIDAPRDCKTRTVGQSPI